MSAHTFRLTHFTLPDDTHSKASGAVVVDDRLLYYWSCACGSVGRKSHDDPLGAQADWAHHVKVQHRKAAKP